MQEENNTVKIPTLREALMRKTTKENQVERKNKVKIMKRRKLPRGGEDIMKVLDISGPMTQKQILGSVDQPERTVRYGIRRLLEKGILKKMSNLSDMRSVYYYLDLDIRANFEFLASSKNEVEVSQSN